MYKCSGECSLEKSKEGGKKSNFINESLRQNLFWLQILKEHALFIRLGLPCEDEALRAEAKKLENAFERLLNEAKRISRSPTVEEVMKLNREAIILTTSIIDFKSRVLKLIICCKITTGFNYPLLIDHIRREAIFFRANLARLQKNIKIGSTESLIQQELFWMRIMADHSKFILHLLDPSERRFVDVAEQFSERFDQLRLHARDFESMLVPQTFENSLLNDTEEKLEKPKIFGEGVPDPFVIGSLERFTGEAIEATKELRDFKATALELIKNCRVLSIISPLLAEHVLREAIRAIEDITLLQAKLPQQCFSDKSLGIDACDTKGCNLNELKIEFDF